MGAKNYILIAVLLSGLLRAQFLLNEFLIDAEDENSGEFIEIFNGSPAALRLDACFLCDELDTDAVIPFPDSLLPSGAYGIILDPGYGGEYEDLIPDSVPRFSIEDARFGMYGISNSSPKRFSLLDSGKNILDSYVTGTPCWPPPEHSIERYSLNDSIWQPSLLQRGTPGQRNSTAIREYALKISDISACADGPRLHLEIGVQNTGLKQITGLKSSCFVTPDPGDSAFVSQGTLNSDKALAAGDSCLLQITLPLKAKGLLNARVSVSAAEHACDTLERCICIPIDADEIIITEFVCKTGDRFPLEYVEYCSRSPFPLNCRGMFFADESDRVAIVDNYLLMPDSLLVLAPGPDFLEFFPKLKNVVFPSAWRSLNNNGDAICLLNASGTPICSLHYNKDWQIPDDCAMLLADTALDYRNPYFWELSESGSPGKYNSTQSKRRHYSCPEHKGFFSAADTLRFHLVNDGYFPVPAQNLCLETSLNKTFIAIPESFPGDTLLIVPDTSQLFLPGTAQCRLYCSDSSLLDVNFLYYYPCDETPLLFNEILFEPLDAYGQQEFVEFECRAASSRLRGWTLKINERSTELSGIFGKGFITVGKENNAPAGMPVQNYLPLPDFPALPNSGARCLLLDPMQRVMDSCQLREHPALHAGKSLEKAYEGLPSGNSELWHECVSGFGMTPGKRNSVTALPAMRDNLGIDPQIFSPGEDERICFHIDSETGIKFCELYCFNMAGQVVFRRDCGVFSQASAKIFWDGRRPDGEYPARGIYPVLAILYDVDGNIRHLKKTLIIR